LSCCGKRDQPIKVQLWPKGPKNQTQPDFKTLRINVATELAAEENKKKEEILLVPEEFHEYLDVFSETEAKCFPDERTWDHKIEMKEGFKSKSFKNYI
jgi:hypothetical protein